MTHPFPLFEPIWSPSREVLVTPEITSALEAGAAVAIGVSGGKDSAVTALATIDYLKDLGHCGPRVLIHSDLGRVEWRQSLPACHRLADRLGLELIVVRRETGDLLDRWRSRWENNVRRYAEMSCVKLILPWSTASMRFCTSELKTSIICRALVQRFAGQTILSAIGIRRQESPNRAKAPVAKQQPKLASVSQRTQGWDWHPILDWTAHDVFGYLEERGFALHEAYTVYGSSRVSCCFCVLSAQRDLAAATRCAEKPGGIPGPGRLGGGVDVSVSADALVGGRCTALAYRGTAPGGNCCQGGHATARSRRGEDSATPAVYRGLAKNDPDAG